MYPSFSLRRYVKELFRPWKLTTFFMALGYYIWGAYYYQVPTWDVPVSLIMGGLTYLFAPWTVKSAQYLIKVRPRHWVRGLFVCAAITYGCASGSYELYNWWHLGYHPPPTYWANLFYSIPVFIGAGLVWKFDGSLRELLETVRRDIRGLIRKPNDRR